MSEELRIYEVHALLSKALGEDVDQFARIYKERGEKTCLVKPKLVMPRHIWRTIHAEVKKRGGRWRRHQKLWEVPLA